MVLCYTIDKLLNQEIEGKKIVAVSLIKEVIHLQSDLNTKNSLPLPIVSAVNPRLAAELEIPDKYLTNVYFVCMDNVNILWEQLTNAYNTTETETASSEDNTTVITE